MRKPLVTIVTPSYNQGHFIRATIESVLSQDYPHVEYIIMDGGSTDQTASVVKDYASRLTFISERDRGQSHAINKGFQMGRGDIVAWLNSDDLYLPGCIGAAVEAFNRNHAAGAVYGDGYLIDAAGNTTSRFPHTQAFDLWRLTYLSDYILQQSVYFRKDVLDDVGYLDESLHYTMDWDLFIRIGRKYQLEYITEPMGCLREYPEAKSSAGGKTRIREIRQMLHRHTGSRFSPGYIVYGLDTYHKLWCDRVDQAIPPQLKPVSDKLKWAIRVGAGLVITHTIEKSQGLYADGWAGSRLKYVLPPGSGELVMEGSLPTFKPLQGQRLRVAANRKYLGEWDLSDGDFEIRIQVPAELASQLLELRVEASRSVRERFSLRGTPRRLAYKFKSLRWRHADPGKELVTAIAATRA